MRTKVLARTKFDCALGQDIFRLVFRSFSVFFCVRERFTKVWGVWCAT